MSSCFPPFQNGGRICSTEKRKVPRLALASQARVALARDDNARCVVEFRVPVPTLPKVGRVGQPDFRGFGSHPPKNGEGGAATFSGSWFSGRRQRCDRQGVRSRPWEPTLNRRADPRRRDRHLGRRYQRIILRIILLLENRNSCLWVSSGLRRSHDFSF